MKQKKKNLFFLLAFVFSVSGYAQMPYLDTAWMSTSPIVGTGIYYHTSTIVVSGQLVSTGRVLNGNGDTDIITTKYNTNGTVAWSQTSAGNFTGGGDDYGVELISYSNGDIVVVGAVKNNTTGYDYRILRYNASGTLLWSYTWNRTGVDGDDIPTGVTLAGLAGGPAYVCGGSEASNGFSDFGVIALTSTGTFSWANFYNHTSSLHDAATKIQYSPTGCNVTGASANAINDWDIATVKFNNGTGAIVSTTRTNTTATMVEARAMTIDSLNNVYITGYGTMGGDRDIHTIKLDSSMNIVWQTYHEGTFNDVGNDVTVDASGNVYVTGYSALANGRTKAILIKYAANGDTLFTQYYGNIDEGLGAKGKKIVIDDNSDVLITGTTEDHDTIQQMYFTQYDGTGALQLASEFTSYGIDDEAFDIDVDADSIYITGLSSTDTGPVQSVIKFVRLQNPDPSYFYLGGEKSYWCQQPGMYSFGLTDSTELTGYVDSIIVVGMRYYPVYGIHYVFFSPEASAAEVDSVIDLIEAEPDFDKEYLVATLTRHASIPYHDEYYAGTSNHLEVIFDDPTMDIGDVEAFADEYEMELIFAPDATIENGVYVFRINDRTDGYYSPTATIDIAAEIWENDSDTVERVMPSLRIFRPADPNDPLYSNLWWAEDGSVTCNGTFSDGSDIGLDCAWNYNQENDPGEPYYSGDGIVVAVIDFHAVEFSHPDASGMFINGWHCPGAPEVIMVTFMDTYLTYDNYEAHLMNVSGIIGGRGGNNEGSIGVAHNAEIIPCLHYGASDELNMILQKLILETGAREVDVINMSLGWGALTYEEAVNMTYYPALLNCYQNGRPDPLEIDPPRGIVLVAGAGHVNSGSSYKTSYPASFDIVLSVGSTTPDDEVKLLGDDFEPDAPMSPWESRQHETLDVTAPGICITSMDHTDNNPEFPVGSGQGYAIGDYYYTFSGTSASAPIVSGIAALVLEKDGTLTNEEVYDAIRFSCEKVGGYAYSNNWETGRCLELGFGRVNACAALNILPYLSDEGVESTAVVLAFPNPATSEVVVTIDGVTNYSLTIIDISGKTVFAGTFTQSQVKIDLSQYANGLYYLNVVDLDSNESYNSKIVKQ